MTGFDHFLRNTFSFPRESIEIGRAKLGDTIYPEVPIRIPLAMMNRHGLIAGSTGTGKTRTLQLLTEGLSRAGVPAFVADVKGDVSGLAANGTAHEKITERATRLGYDWTPQSFPCEFYSLTGNGGTQIRATISSFGPLLLAKALDLTETQQSVLAMVFEYCDDRGLPLLDFHDLREVLRFLGNEGKQEAKAYGGMSPATVGVLFRKMTELEQQGAERFFGEPELDIHDLLRLAPDGRGIVNVLSLTDVQDKPRLFSTFLMWLLGRLFYTLPEVGDLAKPKLVFFFDEAHLLFEDASSALSQHIEQVARLIRSKGVGVFFVTHTPKDVDEDVLAQLGNRVQHAVRAFTPGDVKKLRATASTFPATEYYDVAATLQSLGVGEALTSVLDPKGVPTPTAAVQILPPSSSMSVLDPSLRQQLLSSSQIAAKYRTSIDRESAKEILRKRLEDAEAVRNAGETGLPPPRPKRQARQARSAGGILASSAAREAARSVAREVVRGVFGLLRKKW